MCSHSTNIVTRSTCMWRPRFTCQYRAIIRCPDNLKFFFAGIPQGPLETSPGTIKKIQKRFQGFLKFLVFVKNSTKLKNWLSHPHFWADFQVSYHFGKLLTVRLQGHPASKNLSLHQ